jgi:ABC-type nitrate/sulfonate/bicarbonate transport system substrate-binding protein
MKLRVNAKKSFSQKLILVLSSTLCLGLREDASALDEAKIHVAGTPNITSFVYHLGKEKGFYREEGIELQPIMAGMLQGIQGLIGGSFDYSQMLGQGGGAILRGAPLKIVMAFDTRPSWFLLGGKNMKTLQDLRGKQLAVSSFGAALDQMTRELLPRFGMEPMRDVVLRAIEPPPNRLAALLSGAVDAAVLTHPETIIARKQGFNELIFYGDHIEFVSAGVVATEIFRRSPISSAVSSGAPSRRSTLLRPMKRKSPLGWPKPQSLPRVTASNSTGPGSNFFRRTARYLEASRKE